MNREFKGVWIPKELIKAYGASDAAKISGLFYSAPNIKISDALALKRKGMVYRQLMTPESAVVILRLRSNLDRRRFDFDSNQVMGFKCEWCNTKTISLQEHHYPIPSSEGGIETVSICAQCHSDYHTMVNAGLVMLKEEIAEYFDTVREDEGN